MQSMADCIFCKIGNKEIPAEIVYEGDDIIAFRDAHPIAPVHILIVPKRHIASINDLREQDIDLAGRMLMNARKIAEDLQIAENGYKLLIRTGRDGGQEVPHLHLHLIGGAELSEDIRPI